MQGTPVSKREKGLCAGVSRAHLKSFKLDLKGNGIKTDPLDISLRVARQNVLVRSFRLCHNMLSVVEHI